MNERSLLRAMRETALTLLQDIEQGLERCNLSGGRAACTRSLLIDGYVFHAEAAISGVLINPALPDGFDNTPLDARSDQQAAFRTDPDDHLGPRRGDGATRPAPG